MCRLRKDRSGLGESGDLKMKGLLGGGRDTFREMWMHRGKKFVSGGRNAARKVSREGGILSSEAMPVFEETTTRGRRRKRGKKGISLREKREKDAAGKGLEKT